MAENDLGIEERLRRKMGRPARNQSVATRFTDEEAKRIADAAALRGLTVREWARETMLQAAGGPQTDPILLAEVVALRLLMTIVLRSVALGEKLTPEAYSQILAGVRADKYAAANDMFLQYQAHTKKEK